MGKIQKVVIDTNVILSAFGWGGKPLQIIELLERGMIRNCVSEQTLKELIVALAYPKLAFSHATQTSILEFVLAYSDMYDADERIFAAPDPDDDKFIECSAAANAKIIITGDKRFLSVKRYGSIRVLSPQDFLQSRKIG
jgi:putative PIN family toxin of toxin-antitoxin system